MDHKKLSEEVDEPDPTKKKAKLNTFTSAFALRPSTIFSKSNAHLIRSAPEEFSRQTKPEIKHALIPQHNSQSKDNGYNADTHAMSFVRDDQTLMR